ncbi:phosphotyrosine-protein phosphatase [Vibrio sinaloensis DSM 21326]|uniref:protein-tyrosine-phosphatase n=1 Tax=Vibrio sinaloensis DSM 21326 TaxID=945550 RepID=E8MAW9_PHOS4|nr:low molecular weight protein-tyrosine-phosphatase [Vibrio sinaloensis]EGA68799.1 phosphotyrosine-protein phosphatase [Vibrio sinaloensis DSM 21326]
MFNNILVVCMGNICRSPVAEAMLSNLLPTRSVNSAGIVVEKSKLSGSKAAIYSIEVAAEHDIDITEHRARQLTQEMCVDADLILVMDQDQIERVASISPTSRSKTLLLGQWSGEGEIDDPYQKEKRAFQLAYQSIHKATEAWARRLS